MRRKGERPLPVRLNTWEPGNPLVRVIEGGKNWFQAWSSKQCMPQYRLEQLTGIPQRRLDTISQGSPVTRAEIDALACAWSISSSDLINSMGGDPRPDDQEPYVVEMATLGRMVDDVRAGRVDIHYLEDRAGRVAIARVDSLSAAFRDHQR